MAEAFSATNLAGYGSALSTGLQMAGQIYSAIQAQKLGRYNAQVAEVNAQQDAFALLGEAQQRERLAAMLQDELAYIESVRAFELSQLESTLDRQEGAIEAKVGASGLAMSGSPLAALEEHARQGQIQQLTLDLQHKLQLRAVGEERTQQLYSAELARFGAGQRLTIGRQQSSLIGYEAGQRSTAGILGAVGEASQGYAAYTYMQARASAAEQG